MTTRTMTLRVGLFDMVRRGIPGRALGRGPRAPFSPMRCLALAVIARALDDICYRTVDRSRTRYQIVRDDTERLEALAWICDGGESLDTWCDAAGLRPELVWQEAVERFSMTPLAWLL